MEQDTMKTNMENNMKGNIEKNMDMAIIADEDTLLGFKLVGVRNTAVFNKSDNSDTSKIKTQIDDFSQAKILILTESVAEYLRKHDLMDRVKPVVAEIPDKYGSKGYAQTEISRLFESAIGVALKEE